MNQSQTISFLETQLKTQAEQHRAQMREVVLLEAGLQEARARAAFIEGGMAETNRMLSLFRSAQADDSEQKA